jgi:hypothetical protein
MPLKMTEERAEMLRQVADGEVWRQSNGESVRYGEGQWGESVVERVSQQMADMEAAGWVYAVAKWGGNKWALIDAGREALAGATQRAG